VLEGHGDPARILRGRIEEYFRDSLPSNLSTVLRPKLHPAVLPIVEYVLSQDALGLNVNDVSRAIGCTPRTLARRFANAGLSTSDSLITRLRWLQIAEIISAGQLGNSEVARIMGFSNSRAMRAAAKRRLGVEIQELTKPVNTLRIRQEVIDQFSAVPTPHDQAAPTLGMSQRVNMLVAADK
jgi:AraC-like DNA-binding protein